MRTINFICSIALALAASKVAIGAELEWKQDYSEAFAAAKAGQKDLLVYFAPVKATAESTEFEQVTLADASVRNLLEARVLLKLTTESDVYGKGEAFAKTPNFAQFAPNLATYGGYVRFEFAKDGSNKVKNVYSFQPSSAGSFKSWDAKNFADSIQEKIKQDLTAGLGQKASPQNGQSSSGGSVSLDQNTIYYGSPNVDPNTLAQARAQEMARLGSINHLGGGQVQTSAGTLWEGSGMGGWNCHTCTASNGSGAIGDGQAVNANGTVFRCRLFNSPTTNGSGGGYYSGRGRRR